jgi:hypothetical protein
MSTAKKMRLVGSKPVHWTKRPENAERVKKMVKKREASRKRNKRAAAHTPTTEQANGTTISEDVFAYALGWTECWITTYAASAGVPPEALAARMGEVLSVKNRG